MHMVVYILIPCLGHPSMNDELSNFRRGQGCDKSYLGGGRDLYVAFTNLDNAYDIINRKAKWHALHVYG